MADGGLGMIPVKFSMCHVGDPEHTYQKHSILWLRHKATLQYFVTEDGDSRKLCCEECPCLHYNSHKHLRPQKGDESDERRGSVYPDELAYVLVNTASDHFAHVRTRVLDAAYSADGNSDKCVRCGGLQKGGTKVWCCDNCPDVYHWQCIPRGTPKPIKDSLWYCPNAACQAKAKATKAVCKQAAAATTEEQR